MLSRLLLVALLMGAAVAGGAEAEARPPRTFANPVLDADFPDPALIRAPDGFYYAYATQTKRGEKWTNIQVVRSADLVTWTAPEEALPVKPSWASQTQDFWAPHVTRHGGRYLMYYSAKPDLALKDDKAGLCLAVAVASSPAGPFTDMGKPLQCGEGFAEIDPMRFDDPVTGKRLLYWGSGFKPIRVQELSADGMSFAPGSRPRDLISPSKIKDAFPVLVEAPWVVRRSGYYYLFYSGDNCCGPKANYAVMVARSRSATGPFTTLEQVKRVKDSLILQKGGKWSAPGHNALVTDAAGLDWMVYHAIDRNKPRTHASDEVNTRRVMLVDRIRWRKGWPVIDGPTSGPRAAPLPAR